MKKRLFQSIFTILSLLCFSLYSQQAKAQNTFTDTVCVNSQNVVYGISNADPNTKYTWYLSDPNAVPLTRPLVPIMIKSRSTGLT